MSHRRRHAIAVALVTAAFAACSRHVPPRPAPDHVLFMVFDQMRPDYIDRFGLANFKRLRASSHNYPDAIVGHMTSVTVVSHLVMSTGLPPGQLPWTDEAMLDREGVLGKPGAAYNSADLTREQKWQLIAKIPRDQFLAARIHDTLGGAVFAVGEKNYSTQLLGGPYATGIVTLAKASGRCTPDGMNVPDYIASNPRFTLDCAESYGTGFSTLYALDGSHYVPGRDPAHLGGDVWTADAALAIMEHESWSGLFLTFGGIDKVAHLLGEQDDHGLQGVSSEYKLADILRTADEQLGRVLSELDKRGLTDRTLIVLTADHGGQRSESYLGNNVSQSCCPFENVPAVKTPPYWLEYLGQIGKLKTGYADTALTLWLAEQTPANEHAIIQGLKDVSGITEIYALRRSGDAYRYDQVFSNLVSQSARFQAWARGHSPALIATMAGPSAPDLVGLLADGFGFGRIGDHGGAQELVQRIPMMIRVPRETATTRWTELRLMDLAPEITRILGLKPAPLGR